MAKHSTKKGIGERGTEKIKNKENLEIMRDRLFNLTKDFTCSELEDKTGISDSTIKSISNGDRQNPKIDNLISIAKGIPLSIDYITGLTPYNTISFEEREICKYLGISFKALDNLKFLLTNLRFREIINSILESNLNAYQLIEDLDTFLSYLPTSENLDDLRRDEIEETYLKRLNKSFISFKYSLNETIQSLEKSLQNIDNQLSVIDKKLKDNPYSNNLNTLNDSNVNKKELNEYFKLTNQKYELMQRRVDIEKKIMACDGDVYNGKKK